LPAAETIASLSAPAGGLASSAAGTCAWAEPRAASACPISGILAFIGRSISSGERIDRMIVDPRTAMMCTFRRQQLP